MKRAVRRHRVLLAPRTILGTSSARAICTDHRIALLGQRRSPARRKRALAASAQGRPVTSSVHGPKEAPGMLNRGLK